MNTKCVICGIEVDENTPVCPKCGTHNPTKATFEPVIIPEPSMTEAPDPAPTEPEPPAKKKPKPLPWILAGVALILVIAILTSLLPQQQTPSFDPVQAAFDKSITLLNGDLEVMQEMAPIQFWQSQAKVYNVTWAEYVDMLKSDTQIILSSMERKYGNYTVSGQILTKTQLSSSELSQFASLLRALYSLTSASFSSGYLLHCSRTISYEGGTAELPQLEIYAIKINDTWYLITYSTNSITFFFS